MHRYTGYIDGHIGDLARSQLRFQRVRHAEAAREQHSAVVSRATMQVDFGDEPGSEHNLHLTANAHYEHAGTGGSPAYSPFRHPGGGGGVPAIDPGLHQSTATTRNGHAPMSSASHHQTSPNHLLQPDHAAHLSHGFYGDMRTSQTPPAPSHASPRFAAISPISQPKQLTTHYVSDDRAPPPRDVSDDAIDEAYATFIFYCNPNFPTSTDTTELVKLFRTPPKSDGNAFSTWTLFELIRKFDAKEIKTWTQLALDLGVKPPNTDEGQSTQKVQQYSVRLKVRPLNTLLLSYVRQSPKPSSKTYFHFLFEMISTSRSVFYAIWRMRHSCATKRLLPSNPTSRVTNRVLWSAP